MNEAGGLAFPNAKTECNITVITTECDWFKGGYIRKGTGSRDQQQIQTSLVNWFSARVSRLLFSLKIVLIFIYMYEHFSVCTTCMPGVYGGRRGYWIPGIGVTDDCVPLGGCW